MQTITRRHITAAALLIGAIFATDALVRVRDTDGGYMPDFSRLPERIGNRTAQEQEITDLTMALLQPDAIRDLLYVDESASVEWVDITFIYGKDWRPIHSPLHCYTADGWSIGKQEAVVVRPAGALPHEGDLIAKQLEVRKGKSRILVLYALAYQGGTTASWPDFAFKVATGHGHPGGMILLLSAPIPGSDKQAAVEAVREVLSTVYPTAVAFWYE